MSLIDRFAYFMAWTVVATGALASAAAMFTDDPKADQLAFENLVLGILGLLLLDRWHKPKATP